MLMSEGYVAAPTESAEGINRAFSSGDYNRDADLASPSLIRGGLGSDREKDCLGACGYQ
jgi:hypothetical protein